MELSKIASLSLICKMEIIRLSLLNEWQARWHRSCERKKVCIQWMVVISFTQQIPTHLSWSTLWGQGNQVHLRSQRPKQGSKSWSFLSFFFLVFANLELEPQKLIDALEFQSQLCFLVHEKENRGEKNCISSLLGLRGIQISQLTWKWVSNHWALLPGTNTMQESGSALAKFHWSLSKCLNTAPQCTHMTLSLCHFWNLWFDSSSLSFQRNVEWRPWGRADITIPQAGQALS